MSVRCVWTGFSTSVIGLRGSFHTRVARFMTPRRTVRIFSFRAVVHPPTDGHTRGPPLDALGRDVLEALVAEGREEVRLEDRVVVPHRGRLGGAVLLDP